MEGDEEIQAKQTLLQTEIIEKNYDKTAFINFCLSKKENGDDLNNWTLDELTEIVREFVNSQTQGQGQTELRIEEVKQEGQKEGEGQEIKKEDIEKMEKFNAEDSKNFKERVIECRKLEKTQLNENKLVITVRNPKKWMVVFLVKIIYYMKFKLILLVGLSTEDLAILTI